VLLSVSIVAVLLVVVGIYWWRRPQPADSTAGPQDLNLDGSGRFHAVSIRIGSNACEQARALHGTRVLAANAPQLPLQSCDVQQCQCRLVHHGDRRDGDDRRSPFQRGFGGSATRRQDDRRSRPDRRRPNPGDQPER
jgi:hypothetical protein